MLGLHLDRHRTGTHYSDRLHRILGVCETMRILTRDARTFYHGQVETYRQELVHPIGEVQLTPQYERYGLRVNPSVLERITRLDKQFAYALNVPRVRVEVEGDAVYVCVPRERDADVASFEAAWALAPNMDGALLCGVADDGAQAVLDLSDPAHPHAACIGMTGSGKSTLMQTMLLSAEMQGLRVAILDPTPRAKSTLWPLSGHPAVWGGGLFADPAQIETAMAALAGEAIVFVDEVPTLCAARPGIAAQLTRIAQAGRHAELHLVLGSQDATGIPALKNVAARLVGRMADKQQAAFASGRDASGAERLRGKGDMMFYCGDAARHFQAAMCGPALLQDWRRRYPPRLGALPPCPAEAPASASESARMLDGIPRRVVRAARTYYTDHGEFPSPTWVETHYHMRKPKARRAINLAALDLGLSLPYPDWEREYSDAVVKTLEVSHA